MKRKSRIPLHRWLFGAAVAVLLVDIVALPFVLAQRIEWQTVYYAVASVALALILTALVELRFADLEKKLDKLLDTERKP